MAGSAAGVLAGGIVADRFGPRIATAAGTLVSAAVLLVLVGSYELPTTAILVAITPEYFLFAALDPGAMAGRARFALRAASFALEREFT